jgi:PTS system nitrogen regulatory IIA component
MHLKEYLREGFIVARLNAHDVEGALMEIAARAEAVGLGPAELIAEKLLERERSHPTVMGAGLAIPHATVPGLSEPAIGVALAPQPIPFGPSGEDPVRVLFVLLSPPSHEREHVKLLARICRLARHHELIRQLEAAPDEDALLRIVEAVDQEHA